ncbi:MULTISPECIES: ABC transporter permease [Thermomonas]|jgi:phospholipid/cholesterol/gamma-HCH transport system permease protein|uniref:ABC transporter permease n=1 Tax=Thermomonas beijingensis TaxID=2872701 RepID=A0ABS7TAI2_9GAMM|nr:MULTISPECIES: ABC transporter permease [Thermomonas]MBS0460762.1 ABC transporter permease [Pseudomonadota bacterium]MDE2381248.1 ABC transporter permease [Xanthomonadaceae bacterium]MBZ4184856.1 ABC transporter permease [Thermomonas beijingensis]HQE07918.1 ABC transporter permease [Thermomonas sp.]HQQ58015.1 ABC transporter permease [Thermomonas sp.]
MSQVPRHSPPVARLADDDAGTLRLGGRWTLRFASQVTEALACVPDNLHTIDARGCERLDTLGVLQLLRFAEHRKMTFDTLQFREDQQALVAAIEDVHDDRPQRKKEYGVQAMLGRVGLGLVNNTREIVALVSFMGEVQVKLLRLIKQPWRLRLTSTVHHMEQVGLDAVPLVALLSFMVGAVIAFLGAMVLQDFGATIYIVELVNAAFLREFGVLLTAILLAGRTASAFTAQIGMMVNREEVDAIRVLGLDPVDLLVIPRLLALLAMLPLLTFIAMVAGILGGMAVGAFNLDIPATAYIARMHETLHLRHFVVGMVKAPFFAMIIALIGCLEGLQVEGTAQSLGERTTSSVVQAISMVIIIDAFAALWFMQMDY